MANFLDTIRTVFMLSGTQAFPAHIARTNLYGVTTYTPPSDGYIGFYTTGSADVFQMANNSIIVRAFGATPSGAVGLSNTIPVIKGEAVTISGTGISELWFIPSAGSQ